ncbi:hypothetical protein DRO47_06415 [Candidatus Bathyarchaeota archaeon]|nr:MAG: hypothetical protein DRO47_06415 [Candidatus Bathyarchaeota archaeon]
MIVMVETFGQSLGINNEDISEYLRKLNLETQSPSTPFREIEPKICFMVLFPGESLTPEKYAYIGYHIGSADVPVIPVIFFGKVTQFPRELTRLNNVFCVEDKQSLKKLLQIFIKSLGNERIINLLDGMKTETRFNFRKELLQKIINLMSTHSLIEEYKEEL